MTINLDPNRIRLPGGSSGKLTDRRPSDSSVSELPPKPARAHVNFMPSPESLRTLIASAVTALARGVRWDRGTILNLLV